MSSSLGGIVRRSPAASKRICRGCLSKCAEPDWPSGLWMASMTTGRKRGSPTRGSKEDIIGLSMQAILQLSARRSALLHQRATIRYTHRPDSWFAAKAKYLNGRLHLDRETDSFWASKKQIFFLKGFKADADIRQNNSGRAFEQRQLDLSSSCQPNCKVGFVGGQTAADETAA